MKIKNLKKIKKIHFIGIGGVSMSALANFALSKGFKISGSDLVKNDYTEKLEKSEVEVFYGHNAANVKGADLIVYNSAIKKDNPELVYANENSIPAIERNRFLKIVSDDYKNIIAVSGSHGKTSTSALISEIFYKCGKFPGMHLGGDSSFFDSNFVKGKNSFFITEACEYKRNFLSLNPDIAIILNIDEDHPDYYKDLNDVKAAFKEFSKTIKIGGKIIINADDNNSDIFPEYAVKIGINKKANYAARNIIEKEGKYGFDLFKKKIFKGRINLSVYGYHNIYNALFGFAAADIYNLNTEKIIEAINDFKGVDRRFENMGKVNDAKIISDYAHHPKEIAASILSAKALNKNVTCVFQSHTYSRTKKLLCDFARCFKGCNLILTDIYAAREEYDEEVFLNLVRECKAYADSVDCTGKENILEYLKSNVKEGIILVLGAGDLHFYVKDQLGKSELS